MIEGWKYYDDAGQDYRGWHWMTSKEGETTPHWSYFGDNGILRTGNQTIDGKKVTFDKKGWLII